MGGVVATIPVADGAGRDGRRERVRRLGTLIETVHAVVYFAPEPQDAYRTLGLRGYWRGYFASRAAALGPVGPELVTALFAGFAPGMVTRAVPEVWAVAAPAAVVAARQDAATAALERILGPGLDEPVRTAADLTGICVAALPTVTRPMAAAHRALPRPTRPLAALWHDCTVLREHRGDGHLIAVAAAGLTWPEPHLLQGGAVDARQQEYRGWDDETWHAAAVGVRGRTLTEVEATTDRLAAPAFAVLDDTSTARLEAALEPLATRCAAALPYPNAMALAEL